MGTSADRLVQSMQIASPSIMREELLAEDPHTPGDWLVEGPDTGERKGQPLRSSIATPLPTSVQR